MPHRKISESELVAFLNTALEQHRECNDCRIEHIRKCSEVDEQGCNWSLPFLHCSGVPASVCTLTAEKVIFEARKIFNLE